MSLLVVVLLTLCLPLQAKDLPTANSYDNLATVFTIPLPAGSPMVKDLKSLGECDNFVVVDCQVSYVFEYDNGVPVLVAKSALLTILYVPYNTTHQVYISDLTMSDAYY